MAGALKKYVLGFYFRHQGSAKTEVLLVLKNRPPWQNGRVNGIGGHIEPGETPEGAMEREFREETGLDFTAIKEWRLFAILRSKGDTEDEDGLVYAFRIDIDYGPAPEGLVNDVGESIGFYDLEYLPPNVLSNIRWLLEMSDIRCSNDHPFYVEEKARGDG